MRRTVAVALGLLLLSACASDQRDEAGFIEAAASEWTDFRPESDSVWLEIGDRCCDDLDAMDDVTDDLTERAESEGSFDPGWQLASQYLCPQHADDVAAASIKPDR